MDKVSENPFKTEKQSRIVHSHTALMTVTALFVTLYLVSNVMAVKVISIFGLFYFDAGTITFPFAYMLGDVLTEIWGFKTARRVIWMTFFCNIMMVMCTQVGVWLPSPDYLSETADAYNHIFTYVPRIVIGSLTGFLLGELSNAWLMEKIREKTKGKKLWVRTIGSSAVAYWFDSLPFVLIAFLGVVSTRDLLLMIAFQYGAKLLIETFFGTPMAYAVIHAIRRYVRKKESHG
ncbi:MAG: queuosine precursor transporter [Bacteroidaceae bacterium]|nr:queuosine precursor transporter [Bacteroidaceae bacterium]